MDLDPFVPVGIAAGTVRFLDVFLLHCLLSDSPPDTPAEIAALGRNQHHTATHGREPGLRLERRGEPVLLTEWAAELLDQCAPIAAALAQTQRLVAELADEHGVVRDGEPVGLIGAYANETGIVNLVGLWSAPGHRDVGVASALLTAVAEWAATIGADRLRMWVVERNEYAKAFYLNEGFEPTGATIPYALDPRLKPVAMLRKV